MRISRSWPRAARTCVSWPRVSRASTSNRRSAARSRASTSAAYGNTDFDLNASQPVSLIYDDVVQENPILKGFPVFDLEQIEVLRGPQGTLFGRNTPAGVVKFDSVKPSSRDQWLRPGLLRQPMRLQTSRARSNIPLSESLVRAPVGALPAPGRLGRQHASPATGRRARGLRRPGRTLQLLYEPGDVSARCSTCTPATSTAPHGCSAPTSSSRGNNDLVDGFDADQISIDGRNEQELDDLRARSMRAALGSWRRDPALDHRLRDASTRSAAATSTAASARCSAPPIGPGFIPFAAETADGLPDHDQLTQEFRLESND